MDVELSYWFMYNQMSKYEYIQSLIKVIFDSLTDFNCMAKFYFKIDIKGTINVNFALLKKMLDNIDFRPNWTFFPNIL